MIKLAEEDQIWIKFDGDEEDQWNEDTDQKAMT